MVDTFDSDDSTIETLDYENIDSLHNLDVIITVQCGKYIKNCALQNGMYLNTLYNWWLQCQKKIYQV